MSVEIPVPASAPSRRRRSPDSANPAPGAAEATPSAGAKGRLTAAAAFLLPTAVAAAMVFKGLGSRQLWRDEHATWWAAELSFSDLGTMVRNVDAVFTPYYLFMHVWVHATGSSATSMRVPSAVAMAAAAGLVALLGRRMFTSPVGVAAGLAFAVVPTITRYGQEIRPYAFAVAAVLLSTLLLTRALDQPTFKVWIAYTVSVPLIGWSHLASMAVLAAHLVIVMTTRRHGNHIAGWSFAAAAGLGLCFVLPMAATGSGQTSQIAWNNPTTKDLYNFPQNLFGSWAVGAPVMVLGLIGLFFAGRHALPLALWAMLPPVATYVTAAQLHLFLPRYLLFTVPAWLLLAAVAVSRIAGPLVGDRAGRASTSRVALGVVLALAAVGALASQAMPGIRAARGPIPGEPDFRGAGRIIENGQRPADGIAFAGVMTERRAMAYELRDDANAPRDVLLYSTAQKNGGYDATECPQPATCLANNQRLWLVSTSPSDNPYFAMPAKTRAVLTQQYRIVRKDNLANIRVLLLERKVTGSGTAGQDSAANRRVHT